VSSLIIATISIGNSALSAKDYEKAASFYKEAVALSPDGPNSHIYFSNLAAAQMYLEDYHAVVESCDKAIELNVPQEIQ
jgi:small glutamine-rich tetratricopeptide repeat-containing protein alpha